MLKCTERQDVFIVPIRGERVAFTPDKYDARTGILHGNNDRGNPVSISVISLSNWSGMMTESTIQLRCVLLPKLNVITALSNQ